MRRFAALFGEVLLYQHQRIITMTKWYIASNNLPVEILRFHTIYDHRRTGQHPFGGADRVLPECFQWGGGSSRHFPGSILCGVAEFFPLTPVTDPKFVFFFVNCSDRP